MITVPLRDRLWDDMRPFYEAVLAHPFVTGLTDGTLPVEKFRRYVVQDAHYLRDYARALALVGAKAPSAAVTSLFAEHAHGAIEVEHSLHAELFAELGVAEAQALAAPVEPPTLAYTSYLLRAAHQGSFAEGLGAVLPCYWIYARVGEALADRSSPNPLYARWIATYGGADFGAIAGAVLDVVDAVGPGLGRDELDRVRGHVVTTARYEWMFWDGAWRAETWPV